MSDKIWLNLLHFTMRRGLESLWHEKPPRYVKDDNQIRVLQTTFPNFVVSSLTQGGKGVEGLHGPFPVKHVPELSALVQLFYLAGVESSKSHHADSSNYLYVLVIYQDSVLDGLLNPDVIARIESIIMQWARSEVKTKNQLSKKHFKSLKKQLGKLYEEIEERGKHALQEQIARNSLATVLLQVNELLSRKQHHLLVYVYFIEKMLSDLIPLIYTSLVKTKQHHSTRIQFNPASDEGFLDLGSIMLRVRGLDDGQHVLRCLQEFREEKEATAHLVFFTKEKKIKSFVKSYIEAKLPASLHENVYLFLTFRKDSDIVKCRELLTSKLGESTPSIIPLTLSGERTMPLELIQSLADNLIEIAVLTTS